MEALYAKNVERFIMGRGVPFLARGVIMDPDVESGVEREEDPTYRGRLLLRAMTGTDILPAVESKKLTVCTSFCS